jgi:lipoprotein-anchoring transpeptidase ErfK/SrfK
VPHISPDGTREDGSHGCVNMTTAAAKWLFGWAGIGTTVIVRA